MINNYGDYERIFGGLWGKSAMSYAVRDFFGNGGAQAIIVRLYRPEPAPTPTELAAAAAAAAAATTDATEAATRNQKSYAAALAVSQAAQDSTGSTKKSVVDAVDDARDVYLDDPTTYGAHELAAANSVVKAVTAAGRKATETIPEAITNMKKAAADAAALLDPENLPPISTPAVSTASSTSPSKATITLTCDTGTLNLEAANEGSWGNGLEVTVTVPVEDPGPPPSYSPTDVTAAEDLGLLPGDIFNLYVSDTIGGKTESFLNLSVAESSRQIDGVLENQSGLIRVQGSSLPTSRPIEIEAAEVEIADKASDGLELTSTEFTGGTTQGDKEGLYALENADLFNLLCIPPHTIAGQISGSLITSAAGYALKRRAIFIVDPPNTWNKKADARTDMQNGALGSHKNAAVFFPRLRKPDPLRDNQLRDFVPCGAVAGVIARTDSTRGLWKAPAGLDATLKGVPAMSIPLTDAENGELNPLGLNCLRAMGPAGRVIWGSRTLKGHDQLASEWKYLPVRRVALYIEESLYRGTHWAVFEPNDEPLWAQIRLNLGAFMHNMFRQGAFQGSSPKEAYFVKCSKETTTQNDINLGIVNILIGFAPLKPAEFVIIKIQQMAGQVEA